MKQRYSNKGKENATETLSSFSSPLPLHSAKNAFSPTKSTSPNKSWLRRRTSERRKLILIITIGIGLLVILFIAIESSSSRMYHHKRGLFGENITESFSIETIAPLTKPTLPRNIVSLSKDQLLEEWEWPPILHVVHTRFMQEQGSLQDLARARLALFQTICIPTMVAQTTQHFFWLIQVDPALDATVLGALLDLVAPHENIYIVPSNVNFRINQDFPGAWRDGAEIDSLQRHGIYNAHHCNMHSLFLAMALESHLPILETRLDADDGLQRNFLHSIQQDALQLFSESLSPTRWMYWCSRRHLEWHWSLHGNRVGRLEGITHDHLCVTPGLTTGFAAGTAEASVPVYPHHEAAKYLLGDSSCGSTAAPCLRWAADAAFAAVRSRTPTSAGMADVLLGDEDVDGEEEPWVQYIMWNALHEMFGLERPQLAWMNDYLKKNLVAIAKDNLMGQCTTGHSCKESAQADLERIVAMQSESNATDREEEHSQAGDSAT